MMQLLKFGPAFGVPDLSPFVLKLETYLRLAGFEYTPVNGDVRKAPKKKLPVLIDGARTIPDSEFAIRYLCETYGDKVNAGLPKIEHAGHHTLRLSLEDHTYFLAVAYRWMREDNARLVREAFFARLGVMKHVVFKLVQRSLRQTLNGQGTLRHGWGEIDRLIERDIEALEILLEGRPYFGGDEPREIDCTTFGFIANMIVPDFDTPFRTLSRQSAPLVDYHNRVTERLFSDYQASLRYPPVAG